MTKTRNILETIMHRLSEKYEGHLSIRQTLSHEEVGEVLNAFRQYIFDFDDEVKVFCPIGLMARTMQKEMDAFYFYRDAYEIMKEETAKPLEGRWFFSAVSGDTDRPPGMMFFVLNGTVIHQLSLVSKEASLFFSSMDTRHTFH